MHEPRKGVVAALAIVILSAVSGCGRPETRQVLHVTRHDPFYVGMEYDDAHPFLPKGANLEKFGIYYKTGPLPGEPVYYVAVRDQTPPFLLIFDRGKRIIQIRVASQDEDELDPVLAHTDRELGEGGEGGP